MNDQCCGSSFCTSALVNGQPWGICADSIPRYSSSMVATLISSAVMQSSISMHDYYNDIYAYIWYFFVSVSQLYMDNQSAMNSHCPDF